MTPDFKRTKFACYAAYFTMASIFSLPPLLFVTFEQLYGLSYTQRGALILINFCTQLAVDLIFTVFSKHFNAKVIVRIMPLITTLGLTTYAVVPWIWPSAAYVGLVIGTVIFSVASGLSEVLLSPVIAAIPSDHPQRDMSLLHSLYAFGVFTVVVISSVFFKIFDQSSWMYLTLFFAALPVIAAVLFMLSPMPDMAAGAGEKPSVEGTKRRALGMALCVGCIFFGSCAENVMSNWVSNYVESALGIDKTLGNILGMAMFAILLGLARILYSRYGKNITAVLLCGMVAAIACYLTVALVNNAVVALIACALTGFVTSMLWPGSLIMMEEKLPGVGVAAFALMAAGGDLGASVAPQLMGVVVDQVSVSGFAAGLGERLGLTTEQVGLKAGMLITAVFPLLGTLLVIVIMRYFRQERKKNEK
ncbi:MAG: MFS transporter [Ruminococcaceae bacterium]|nr:MFS transporter [Oscillospiraceae bacterium]